MMMSGEQKAVSRRIFASALCGVRFALSIGALLIALSAPAESQQSKVPRIGYLATSCDGSELEEFRRGLSDSGYVEGKNIVIECRSRYGDGTQDHTVRFVDEFMRSKVDIFVSSVTPAIVAAKKLTTTIPIVMVSTVDPVATGIVESLARPGGNITGVATLTRELGGKRLELLKEVIPRLARVGILWFSNIELGIRTGFRSYEPAAQALKVELRSLEVRSSNPDFDGAIRDAIRGRADALIISRRSLMSRHRKRIVDLANQNHLPSMFEGTGYVEVGGLIAYSDNSADQYRRAALYVDKILKGAKTAELPIEQATKFELVINLKTAKQIGLTIPPAVLTRADKVIR